MNFPNKLTVTRIVLTPIFMVLYLLPSEHAITTFGGGITWGEMCAAALFILASATDWLDGFIARKNSIITNFGKFMDPLADKLLVTGALCCFLSKGVCGVWVVMIILTREFLVTGLRLVGVSEGIVIAAGKMGKLKTVIQMVTIVIAIILGRNLVVDYLFYLSALITAVSGIIYVIENRQVFSQK